MNFTGVSFHSPETEVYQPTVYGDIQSHHNVSSTLHIFSAAKYHRKGQMGSCSEGIKIDNVEVKIITSVIELGVKSIVALCNEC